jgi:N-acetyl-anhydromuramyl-L-alanine amidase AmpD
MVKIIKDYYTKNRCYTRNNNYKKVGIIVHSTATPGVMAKPFRDRWNNSSVAKAVHAFLDDKEVIECLPETREAWHVGTSTGNKYYFGFEICEDRDHSEEYFLKAYKNAVEYTAVMVKRLGLSVSDVFSHKEGNRKGIASNHGDPEHWFSKFGYTMDDFRRAVYKELGIAYGLTLGDTGNDVKIMQAKLEELGYKLAVDGSFGPATENTVKQFQKDNALLVDGSFGPATSAKADELLEEIRKPKPVVTLAPEGYIYRIRAGGFSVKEYAYKHSDTMASDGYDNFVSLEKI